MSSATGMTVAAIRRKARAKERYLVERRIAKWRERAHLRSDLSPIVVNAFAKSGTHLVYGAAAALPGAVDFGAFAAYAPAITFTSGGVERRLKKITNAMPGEIIRAHLWHVEAVEMALLARRAFHIFVYRDLRDVAVSEAEYIANMAPWHYLHRVLSPMSVEMRLLTVIQGTPLRGGRREYPNIAERFECYAGWLDESETFALRFEEIRERRESALTELGLAFERHSGHKMEISEYLAAARETMKPDRAHTFRRGQVGEWKEQFRDVHREAMKEVAGDLLIRLGYESGYEW